MRLPIKFPSDTEVISEEAARFRALSPAARVKALGEMFNVYHFLISNSPKSQVLMRIADEDETQGRKAIEEFIARHG